MSDKINVLIVDDIPETRENVRKLLQFEPDVKVTSSSIHGWDRVGCGDGSGADVGELV